MNNTNHKWLLEERDDDYQSLKESDPKEYFAGLSREWAYRRLESDRLKNDLLAMGLTVPSRESIALYPNPGECSWSVFKRRVDVAVSLIRQENNRMLLRRSRYYMYHLAQDSVRASGRQLTKAQKRMLLQNPNYLSDDYASDESF